jgi:hypothetical protein
MPRLEPEPLHRVQILLYESDLEELKARFRGNIGYGKAVRHIVRKFLVSLDRRTMDEVVKEAQHEDSTDNNNYADAGIPSPGLERD